MGEWLERESQKSSNALDKFDITSCSRESRGFAKEQAFAYLTRAGRFFRKFREIFLRRIESQSKILSFAFHLKRATIVRF